MSKTPSLHRSNRGQVLIEYLLLVVIVVSVASILIKSLVSRQPGSEGSLIKVWDGILKSIGNDLPDCSKQVDYKTPNCPP